MASSSSTQATSMKIDFGESYKIRGRIMKISEDELIVQVENHVNLFR